MKNLNVIILAAGKGTRMGSELPKVLHQVNGKEMINRVIDTVDALLVKIIGVVVGYQAEKVKEKITNPKALFVMQSEQLGTGHAVMQAESAFKTCQDDEHVLIMAGDCPLIQKETLKKLYKTHIDTSSEATVLSAMMPDPAAYGRILRAQDGSVIGIREAKDCSESQKKIKEINTGIIIVKKGELFTSLKKIKTNNSQKEYYLTDIIELLKQAGKKVSAECAENHQEALGINTIDDLKKANQMMQSVEA